MSLRRYVPHLNGPKLIKEKVLKPNLDKYGYHTVALQKEGKSKTFKVHRLVARAFLGESSLQINHRNCIKTDNHLTNLEYVSPSENNAHARSHLVFKEYKGERHHCFKLSASAKAEIKSLVRKGISRKTIAEKFGIHEMTTYKVIKGGAVCGRQ